MGAFAGRPVVVDTKAAQIRQRLSEAILNGELRPGDRIVLDEIARDLGVSKIPLREALSNLIGEGLVVTTPFTGPRVAPLPLHEIRGIYQLREVVEPLALRLALDQASPELLHELRKVNDRMHRRLGKADDIEMSGLNAEFHLQIARATTFQTIVESVDDLLTKIRRYRAVVDRFTASWDATVVEHDGILTALEAGDSEAAIDLMRAHVHDRGLHDAFADELDEQAPRDPAGSDR